MVDMEDLIRPTPNFFDDVVTHPSSAEPMVCSLPHNISTGEKSGVAEDNSTVVSSLPLWKSRHYDDEDYKCKFYFHVLSSWLFSPKIIST